MKRHVSAIFFAVWSLAASAQGLVNWDTAGSAFNSACWTTNGGTSVVCSPAGSFYFGLFIAPAGTTDPSLFSFSGCYETNLANGRISGGNGVSVPNWPAGTTRSFLVRGWSADLGHDWNPLCFTVTAEDDANFATLVQILTNGTNDWVGYVLMMAPCGGGVCTLERNFFQGLPVAGNGVDLQGYDITSFMLQLDQLAFTTYGVMTYTSVRLRVFVNFQPHGRPFVYRQPCSETAETGSDVRFSLRTEGSPPLFYQWFFNGTDAITTATTDLTLLLTNVQPAQAGAYTVVVTNAVGVVTSTPALLSVIAPVPRRMVPALSSTGQPGSSLNLEFVESLDSTPGWGPLGTVDLATTSAWYFDVSAPLTAQRFYRAWQSGAPTVIPRLDLHLAPALTLTGSIGSSVRVDFINQFGPTDAWVTLATATLTNPPQLYFDTSMIGQPPRLYRILPAP